MLITSLLGRNKVAKISLNYLKGDLKKIFAFNNIYPCINVSLKKIPNGNFKYNLEIIRS